MKKQVSTSLEKSILKELKTYAAENDQAINQTIESALQLYLCIAKDKSWREIADRLPNTETGGRIQGFALKKDLHG